MAKELTDILKAAAEVRDETAMQQNTATRVGGVLTDLVQFVGEAVFAAGMTAKTSAEGVSLLIKYYDADGQPTPFMSGIGGLAHGMSWKKIPSRGNFLPRHPFLTGRVTEKRRCYVKNITSYVKKLTSYVNFFT